MTTRSLLVVGDPPLCAAVAAALAAEDVALIPATAAAEARLIAEIEGPAGMIASASALAAEPEALAAALKCCGGIGACLAFETGDEEAGARSLGSFELVRSAAALREWAALLPSRGRSEELGLDPVAAVRAAYGESLPEKARSLAALAAAAAAERADPERIAAVRRLAHRLRGSAGTFGYWAFGALAAEIDDALAEEGGEGRWQVVEAALLRLARWSS
jgi:HPt (histidine-containing phosphotransfer) domain-containing protein